jgi:predicted secreted Zn-dependent protease
MNLDKPTVTVPFHLSYFRLYDSATITCHACSIPSTTIFDFFRPKQMSPISYAVKDKFDEFINQTCRQITITLYVITSELFLFL